MDETPAAGAAVHARSRHAAGRTRAAPLRHDRVAALKTPLKTPLKTHGRPAIALLVGRLSGGGQSKVQIDLANALARDGHQVDLLYFHSPGQAPRRVCAGVNVVDLRRSCACRGPWPLFRWAGSRPGSLAVLLWQALTARRPFVRPYPGASRTWLMRSTLGLVQYLEQRRPAVLYAAGDGGNLLALTARRISTAESRIVAALHNVPSPRRRSSEGTGMWRALLASRLVCRAIPQADAIVAVSRGVAEEWSRAAHIPRGRITPSTTRSSAGTCRRGRRLRPATPGSSPERLR